VDPVEISPYLEKTGIIWEGLNLINYCFAPHYKSDHSESDDTS